MRILIKDRIKKSRLVVIFLYSCLTVLCTQYMHGQCVSTTANGFQENLLQATFHSALYKTSDGYAASGSSTAPDGSAQPDIQVLSNANGYTGIPATTSIVWGTIGGNAQIILLGDDEILYAGGDEGTVLEPALTSSTFYGPTSLGLPTGIGIGDIQKFQATNEVLMIQTDSGELYVTGNNCGNVITPCVNTAWNLVSMPSGVTAQIADVSAKTLFIYGSDGNFYTRGKRIFKGNGDPSINITANWTLMTMPGLSSGSSPVQIELGNHEHYNQIGYLILDADGSVHSLGDAPIVANNSAASFNWTKVGQNCPNGEINNAIYLTASDNDNRHVGAGVILADSTMMLWGVDDFNMLGGSGYLCPAEPCSEVGSDISHIVYLENGTHLTPAITESGFLCNVGHNSEGGFGDGTTTNRSCYECYTVPSLPDLCIDGSCIQDTTIAVTICDGETHNEQGSAYTQAGTYVDIYQTTSGCDSIVNTQLSVIPSAGITNEVTICDGQSYFEQSSEYTSAGTYTDTYESVIGCDSVVTTILNVVSMLTSTNEVSICEGQSYFEGSSEYSSSGTYEDSYQSSGGCDSVVTTILDVVSMLSITNDVSICEGQSYFEGSSEYTSDGTYQDNYLTSGGCDSLVTTILSVISQFESTNEVSICQGESYTEGTSEYTSSGTYQDSYISTGGCDSLVNTILEVYTSDAVTNDVQICEGQSYFEGASEYSSSGTYQDIYQSVNGCDSVITTDLLVLSALNTTNEITICSGQSYSEQGSTYTENGTYEDLYSSAGGCDSLVTTVLTVLPPISQTNTISMCEGELHEEQGNVYSESGTYTEIYQSAMGCDSIVITDLTVQALPIVDLGMEDIISCEALEIYFENTVQNDGDLEYFWEFGNGEFSNELSVTQYFEEVGDYYVTLVITNGDCQSEAASPLVVQIVEPAVAAFTTNNLSLSEIQFFDESIGNIVQQEWDFGDGNSGTGSIVIHSFFDAGDYTVTLSIEDDLGCTDTISSNVLIETYDDGILIPNAFVPDPSGDGNGIYNIYSPTNEVFFPYSEDAVSMEFYVFNRWGEQIFKSTELERGWDGYFQGKPCPQSVYTYKVKFSYPDGNQIEKMGTVTLFR